MLRQMSAVLWIAFWGVAIVTGAIFVLALVVGALLKRYAPKTTTIANNVVVIAEDAQQTK